MSLAWLTEDCPLGTRRGMCTGFSQSSVCVCHCHCEERGQDAGCSGWRKTAS